MMKKKITKKSGEVAIFVVIFAALLITVVTVSFVGIMINDQQQATNTDLSQSAYDSAQAGVEDAKRAILKCVSEGSSCDINTINSKNCNVAVDTLGDVSASAQAPVPVGTANMNQAYTCTIINLNTPDFLGTLAENASKIIPLVGTNQFNTVRIQWFTNNDLGSSYKGQVYLPGSTQLFTQNVWTPNVPPIMRTQLLQFGSSFKLSGFDATTNNNHSDANTLFLYPSLSGNTNTTFSLDSKTLDTNSQTSSLNAPIPIICQSNLNTTTSNYACTATISLPDPITSGARTAFLRLTSLYNKTSYRVTLLDGSNVIQFKNVQPSIDSTGRASDLYRRVQARVELTDVNFPYPNAAVDLTGNFCKDFIVTDSPDDYKNLCTP